MNKQSKAILAVCTASLIGMANMVTMSVLAYIYQAYAQVPKGTVALILLIPSLVGVFTAFLIGPLMHRIPKKIIILIAIGCVACSGSIFFFLGGNCPIGVLLLGAALLGFVQGSMASVPSAVISENTEPAGRGRFLGFQTASLNAGSLVMSVLGGMLGAARWQNAYAILFISLPIFVFVAIMLPMDHPVQAGKAATERTPIPGRVYMMCIHFALMFICFYTFAVNISSYIITEYQLGSSAQAGIVSALQTVMGVITGIIFGSMVKKTKELTVPMCCFLVAIGYFAAANITGTMAGCIIGSILLGFGKSAVMPYVINQVSVTAKGPNIPVCISMLMGCMNLGMFVSNYVIGFLAGLTGPKTIYSSFTTCAIFSLVTAVLGFFLYRKKNGTRKAS